MNKFMENSEKAGARKVWMHGGSAFHWRQAGFHHGPGDLRTSGHTCWLLNEKSFEHV